jgi:hypothetical protein
MRTPALFILPFEPQKFLAHLFVGNADWWSVRAIGAFCMMIGQIPNDGSTSSRTYENETERGTAGVFYAETIPIHGQACQSRARLQAYQSY